MFATLRGKFAQPHRVGPVAQSVEHMPFKHRVAGSSPARLTIDTLESIATKIDSCVKREVLPTFHSILVGKRLFRLRPAEWPQRSRLSPPVVALSI